MKNAFWVFAVSVAAWMVLYLAGSFVAASFNIMDWDPDGRLLVALGGCFSSFMAVMWKSMGPNF